MLLRCLFKFCSARWLLDDDASSKWCLKTPSMYFQTWLKSICHKISSKENVGKIICCILVTYSLSIGLTFYQQWFIRDFHFPLFVVFSHFVVKFLASALFRKVDSTWHKRSRITLEWRDYVVKVAVTGIAASADIGLSNWSFQYVTVSVYTMAKSTCIVFILIFAVILSLERCKWSTVSVVALIAVGLLLFTYKSSQFNFFGFLLVEFAAFCCGIRWASCQMLLQKKEIGLHNPVDLMFHVQPWMILTIVPLMFIFEAHVLAEMDLLKVVYIAHFIILGGLLGLCIELGEFLLIYYTSSLTLNICGVAKEILTLTLAHFFKNDVLSALNFVGMLLCLCGIILHVYVKNREENNSNEVEFHSKNHQDPNDPSIELRQLLNDDGENNDN